MSVLVLRQGYPGTRARQTEALMWPQGGDCLERAHKIRVVVFDKTGTLTLGRPAVTGHALFAAGRLPLDEVLQLACALEANSEHPLAQAILTFTANR